MQSATILCYGEIDLDIYVALNRLPAVNVTGRMINELENVGGAAANVAMWLANWGIATRLVGHDLGDDRYGQFVRDRLSQLSMLDVDYVVYHSDYQTPRCQCLVTPDGERVFIMHWENEIHISELTTDILDGIRWLNLDVSGPLEPRLRAAQLAKQHGIKVAINDIYTPDHPLLPYVDLITLSASIIRTKHPNMKPLELVQRLQDVKACDVVITDGGDVVHAFLSNGDKLQVQPPAIDVIDTTGAGDIFKAGLLYGLVNDLPMHEALKFAVGAGSVMSTLEGTTAELGSLAQVKDMASKIE